MPEERKLVTILFADVTGSTTLGEDLDPEDVRALMGRYYDHARQVVSDHGGTLEKFIGDAVMAVFGLPHAHGDDAERAVAAALALRHTVAGDSLLAQQLALRVGVNTGEVIATSDPSGGDFLVTGDAVNVAARLQQSASPGEVLVSQRTQAAAAVAFFFGDVRELGVKGKRAPLRAFVVEGVRPARQISRPPLVGRKQDLAQLALLLDRALEERRPQLVSIVAPAGTGKTRLLEEFLARVDLQDGFQVAIGRCPPYGQTLAYWPLRGLLEDLVGEIERDRVVGALARGGYSPRDASRLTDLILAPLLIESEGLTGRESIFNAWRLLIETLTKEAPRIVVFEDLHWASDSLLDLVEHIMHPRTQAPLLIIAISRPELLDRSPTWGGGGRQNFTALVLEPLNEAQTAHLVEYLAGDLPRSVQERIVERSGGNPFFATELVRGVAEQGMGGDVQDVGVVPDTVHAAVLARLDALSSVERAVVQAASVAGRSFRPGAVAAVLDDREPVEIDAAIAGLVARDLAVPAEGDAYTFRHVLIRDVAYGTLSRAERMRMHGAVACWLKGYAADRLDEFVELIAYHYQEAIVIFRRSAIPLPLPFDPAKAVSVLERTGELASRAGALDVARNYIESAISIAPASEHGRLEEKLGDTVHSASITAYQEALKRWREEGADDPQVGARLLRKILVSYSRRPGTTPRQLSRAEMAQMQAEAMRLAEEAGDEDEMWQLRCAEAYWPWLHGDTTLEQARNGRTTALAAAAYFEERGDWESFSIALDAYSSLSALLGAWGDGFEASLRRLAAPSLTALERGDAVCNLVRSSLSLGHYDRAVAAACDVVTQARPAEPIVHFGAAVSLALWAAWLSGQWPQIDTLIAATEDGRQEQQGNALEVHTHLVALQLALARDDRTAADAIASTIARAVRAADLGSQGRNELQAWAAWAAALVNDDPDRLDPTLIDPGRPGSLYAVAYPHMVGLSLAFLSERGVAAPDRFIANAAKLADMYKIDMAARCVNMARAVAARDAKRLHAVIDDAERHGLIPHAARMRIVLAQMTRDLAPLEQARPVLERLGDRQFLRRLEEVAASLR